MSEIRIPQFCCATCKHWGKVADPNRDGEFLSIGNCERNPIIDNYPTALYVPTLDLALCTKWEKSEDAEKAMYGR